MNETFYLFNSLTITIKSYKINIYYNKLIILLILTNKHNKNKKIYKTPTGFVNAIV